MYRIGEFSKINQVTVKTLRYYEKEGLLLPEFIDKDTNYRYYSSSQLKTIHSILSLKQAGFSIKEIKSILQGKNISLAVKKEKF